MPSSKFSTTSFALCISNNSSRLLYITKIIIMEYLCLPSPLFTPQPIYVYQQYLFSNGQCTCFLWRRMTDFHITCSDRSFLFREKGDLLKVFFVVYGYKPVFLFFPVVDPRVIDYFEILNLFLKKVMVAKYVFGINHKNLNLSLVRHKSMPCCY